MPQTTIHEIEYPDATLPGGHVRIHEHLQVLADSVEAALEAVVGDTGWTSISLAAGILVFGGRTPQYKRVGSQVFLRGQIERTASAAFAVGTTTITGTALPAGFRPPQDSQQASGSGSGGSVTSRINVFTTGVISVTNLAASGVSWVALDGIQFWTDA